MDMSLSYPISVYGSLFVTVSKFLNLLYKPPGTNPGFVGPEVYAICGEWGFLLIEKYEILNSKSPMGP